MKCPKCGVELKGEWMFCPDCGERLPEPAEENIQEEQKNTEETASPKQVPLKTLPSAPMIMPSVTSVQNKPEETETDFIKEAENERHAIISYRIGYAFCIAMVCVFEGWLIPAWIGGHGAAIFLVITCVLAAITVAISVMSIHYCRLSNVSYKICVIGIIVSVMLFVLSLIFIFSPYPENLAKDTGMTCGLI